MLGVRRLLPYLYAVIAVVLVSGALGLIAWLLHINRIETYWAIFVIVIGAIAWRYGRGPAIFSVAVAAILSEYYFIPPWGGFEIATPSETVRLISGVIISLTVIQFVSISRAHEVLTEKRKDLLQDVSPRILQSLDADATLETVADATLTVIAYQHLRLYRWDEASERLVLFKSIARSPAYAAIDWHSMTFALGEGITGLAAKSRTPLLVPDASRDPRMIYPPGTQPIAESVLSVPMVTSDRLFGVLTLARLGAGSLQVDDLRLMEAIAAQTALALANAEAYSEAEQTIKALAMIESLKAGDTSQPDSEVDRSILQGLTDFSQADLATLRLLGEDDLYRVVATGGAKWPEGSKSAATGGPLTGADLAWLTDPRVNVYVGDPRSDGKLPEWARRGTERAGVKASIFLPLWVGQRLTGVVGLHWRRPRWFRGEQLGRLQLLAAQAAISLDTRRALEHERRRAEALGQLERARREFMQIASHELRTPLTVIRGYASMLEEGSLGEIPPSARQALKTLLDKSTEMRVQVERMLLLARLEDGAAPPQMAPLDLRTVLHDALERVQPQVALKQGEVNVALANEPLPVIGDSERLATAVDNLLQNAVKFSTGPPQIDVSGQRTDGHITVVVRDHGIGIPPEARKRLFEKFYRVNDPGVHNVAGTGIGLYLVRQVVESHGGHVNVESEPGAGSSFKIELPAAPDPA